MKKIAPKILSGFKELLPKDQMLFNNIKHTIEQTYQAYGFLPMDTPIMESAEVLLAKAGGETEKQIYSFSKGDTNLCLRFDLTVPLARFVAQYQGQLTFPFRRYQIGKVYRGERAQKGRYREFYQCDVDVVGSEKLDIIYDAEVAAVVLAVFNNLGLENAVLNLSNRKLLAGLVEELGLTDKTTDILRLVDKLDKVGVPQLKELLHDTGISEDNAEKILNFLSISGTSEEVITNLKAFNVKNEMFLQGVQELTSVVEGLKNFGLTEENFKINLAIARGLDYYTGTVYETFIKGFENLGSVASGGRYDNLASNYTTKNLPGVGMAIGLTRLYDVLSDGSLVKESLYGVNTKAVILPMDFDSQAYAINIAQSLRSVGLNTEIYFENTKFKNKLAYVDKMGVKYAIIIGEDEINSKKLTLKNLEEHTQETLTIEEAIEILK